MKQTCSNQLFIFDMVVCCWHCITTKIL